MSDADNAARPKTAADRAPSHQLVAELKVSGHLMNLEAGMFCIVQTPSKTADIAAGLPGVRISLPPGPMGRPDAVTIKTFRDDGWLYGTGDAAMVRVVGGPAQVLVTVYQAPNTQDGAPNLQVLRLLDAPSATAQLAAQSAPRTGAAMAAAPQAAAAPSGKPALMEIVAHIQSMGDVGGMLGAWLGERGSGRWIEGYAIAPTKHVTAADIEYQAVLGRGWSSPWVEGGQFCGSRGMALPVLGIRVRLKGEAAEKFTLSYSASFIDGTATGPVQAGEACESDSLAAVEAIFVGIEPVGKAAPVNKPGKAKAAAPAAASAAAATTLSPVKPAGTPRRR